MKTNYPNMSNLDFDGIKQELIDHFKSDGNNFTDWDFEGSNLNTFLDVLAYNSSMNAMTAHFALNESFVDSAQLRRNVVSGAKLIGYTPRSYSAATISIAGTFAINKNSTEEASELYTLSRGDTFIVDTSTKNKAAYQFVVLDERTQLQRFQNDFYAIPDDSPLTVYQGSLISRDYPAVAADVNHRYVIPDEKIDVTTLQVTVFQNGEKLVAERYLPYGSIDKVDATTPIYFIYENSEGLYEINFGNGVFGAAVQPGNIITLEYVKCDGSEANDIVPDKISFVPSENNKVIKGGYNLYLANTGKSAGGSDKEDLQNLKRNAINNLMAQNRAVTAGDYETLIMRNFPNIQSVSVWGGENASPPEYGKVFLCLKPTAKGGEVPELTSTEKSEILAFLRNKKVLSIMPEIVSPEYIDVVLDIFFKYDPKATTKNVADLQRNVKDNVLGYYNDKVLNSFDAVYRHSNFVRSIDESSEAIVNSLCRVGIQGGMEIRQGAQKTTYHINFGVPLAPTNNFVISEVRASVPWRENSRFITLKDFESELDGKYIRDVWVVDAVTLEKIRKVGSINMLDGTMNLYMIYADADTEIKIKVYPRSFDLVGKRNRILRINLEDSIIAGYPDEISVSGSSGAIDWEAFPKNRF